MTREEQIHQNDLATASLLAAGRLIVDFETGLVYARESKTPGKPIGTPNARGYLRTCITTKGKAVTLMVHRIVWIAANGVPGHGQHLNHRDGVKANNAISNLELTTPAANNAHARSAGLWSPTFGLKNGFAKLSEEQVLEVRRLKASGIRTAEIAARMGITSSYVRRIVAGRARGSSRT